MPSHPSVAQYRVDGGAGFWRHFDINNQTQTRDVVYLVESVFHEMLLQVITACCSTLVWWQRLSTGLTTALPQPEQELTPVFHV